MKGSLCLKFIVVLFVSMFYVEGGIAESLSENLKDHVSGGVNIDFRDELWNTFQKKDLGTDRTYDFLLMRARAFIDFDWENLYRYVMRQGI